MILIMSVSQIFCSEHIAMSLLLSPGGKSSQDDTGELYIIGRFCLSVCLSRKMITLPNGLKSSSLAVAISFFKHCNKKMNCTFMVFQAFRLLFHGSRLAFTVFHGSKLVVMVFIGSRLVFHYSR